MAASRVRADLAAPDSGAADPPPLASAMMTTMMITATATGVMMTTAASRVRVDPGGAIRLRSGGSTVVGLRSSGDCYDDCAPRLFLLHHSKWPLDGRERSVVTDGCLGSSTTRLGFSSTASNLGSLTLTVVAGIRLGHLIICKAASIVEQVPKAACRGGKPSQLTQPTVVKITIRRCHRSVWEMEVVFMLQVEEFTPTTCGSGWIATQALSCLGNHDATTARWLPSAPGFSPAVALALLPFPNLAI
uniref:Uncharacterized protein n=1 Tax=Oryza punctata TaxID=4537 RepID=A0A0E0KI05_ORYPU